MIIVLSPHPCNFTCTFFPSNLSLVLSLCERLLDCRKVARESKTERERERETKGYQSRRRDMYLCFICEAEERSYSQFTQRETDSFEFRCNSKPTYRRWWKETRYASCCTLLQLKFAPTLASRVCKSGFRGKVSRLTVLRWVSERHRHSKQV